MKILILLSVLISSYPLFAKELVIVSDLDETLRAANVEKKVKAGLKLVAGVKPYEGLVAIFNEIKQKNPDVKFYYLSNSFTFLYNGKKWTKENGLPEGVILQRKLKDKSDSFKPAKLDEIAKKHPDATFMLFGDNIERDPKFYREFVTKNQIDAQILIRDARLIFPQESDITYFQTDVQLAEALDISDETTHMVRSLAFSKLVPKFLLKNLKKRLLAQCKEQQSSCRDEARARVSEVVELISPK